MGKYKNKFINDVLNAANALYTAKDALPKQIRAFEGEYIGQRLTDEINQLKANISQLGKALNDIHESGRNSMLKEIEESRAKITQGKSLDPSGLVPDFQFLSHPAITLTPDELQTLISRNSYNSLFIRAAQEYERKHSKKWHENKLRYTLDYSTAHDKAIRAIHDCANHFTQWLSQDKAGYSFIISNPRLLEGHDSNLSSTHTAAIVKAACVANGVK